VKIAEKRQHLVTTGVSPSAQQIENSDPTFKRFPLWFRAEKHKKFFAQNASAPYPKANNSKQTKSGESRFFILMLS
jgi:hypothetical protein